MDGDQSLPYFSSSASDHALNYKHCAKPTGSRKQGPKTLTNNSFNIQILVKLTQMLGLPRGSRSRPPRLGFLHRASSRTWGGKAQKLGRTNLYIQAEYIPTIYSSESQTVEGELSNIPRQTYCVRVAVVEVSSAMQKAVSAIPWSLRSCRSFRGA